ncbi:MAG: TonB-dependent receptor plug domain-containing protein, partial [Caldimonas sp.]
MRPAAPARARPAATAGQQLDKVEITGRRPNDIEERRESTAAKIVIGRDEIERFGDSTLGDVLKRLPGITIQGRPGRGGAIRMRGLGAGYTQILLDGERVPPGFSLDLLEPEQVERIEIYRAPTAETGARAIAGTINIVTRGGYTKRINDLRLTTALEDGRVQPHVAWTRNDSAGPFVYNYSLSAFRQNRASDATTTTVDRELGSGTVTLDQHDAGTVREVRDGVHATGRLQWRGTEPGHTLTLTPLLLYSTGTWRRTGVLQQVVPAVPASGCLASGIGSLNGECLYDHSTSAGAGDYSLARLNGQWNRKLNEIAKVEARAGVGLSRWSGHSLRL